LKKPREMEDRLSRLEARLLDRDIDRLKQRADELECDFNGLKGVDGLECDFDGLKWGVDELKRGVDRLKRDADILLPYLEDMRIVRQDVLETYNSNSRHGNYDNRKQRNRIAHGGHVKGDAEAIDQKPQGSTAQEWKLAFHNIYGYEYDEIRPLLSTAPRALVRVFNFRGDTVLHTDRHFRHISQGVRTKCQEILDE
jgi:hypothetical protein